MGQIDIGKWKADNLKEFSERVVLALCTPQKERFTRVNGVLRKINSPVGDESVFSLCLSCIAKFHPPHLKIAEECLEYYDILRGDGGENYIAFYSDVYNYFDRILGSIRNYSPDLYDCIASRRQMADSETLSLELSLLEQTQQDDNLFIGHILSR